MFSQPKEQVAYFTLGTVKNADAADFRAGLTALQEYDGVVVATTGRRLDPEELGPVPANAIVAEFVPQAAVLERADLLVSHSGSGTMLGGLVHGVPRLRCRGVPTSRRTPPCWSAPVPESSSHRTTTPSTRSRLR